MRRSKRAIRRHHYDRLTIKYAKTRIGWFKFDWEDCLEAGRKMATTARNCSCWRCNYEKGSVTRQELTADWAEYEGREEAGLKAAWPRGSLIY